MIAGSSSTNSTRVASVFLGETSTGGVWQAFLGEAGSSSCATTERLTLTGVFADLAESGRLPENPTPAETQAVYATVLPAARESDRVIREMLEELRALAAPTELADDAEELWDAYEERVEIGLRRIEKATVDADAAIALEADNSKPFTPENTRGGGGGAAELGFTACRFE